MLHGSAKRNHSYSGPETGRTQPRRELCLWELSHTATHGAFGAIAFGIGDQ